MKRLFLLRHAKSSWANPLESDHNRSLNSRGKEGARVMGEFIFKQKLKPQKVICSTALRARETWKIFNKSAKLILDPIFDDALYLCSAYQILQLLSRQPDKDDPVMIIGHNPSMIDAVELIIKEPFPFEKYSTAGLCLLELPVSHWHEADQCRGNLVYFKAPKMVIS